MNKGIKILAGTMVFLGVISLIFLLTAKTAEKNSQTKVTPSKTIKQTGSKNTKQGASPVKKVAVKQAVPIQADVQKRKDQWQQCKNKTIVANTTLFWNVQISEEIPVGGTYAKGALDNDATLPVHVIIKSGSQITGKIKSMLVVGKSPSIRGTCTDVATDGSVVLEAF